MYNKCEFVLLEYLRSGSPCVCEIISHIDLRQFKIDVCEINIGTMP